MLTTLFAEILSFIKNLLSWQLKTIEMEFLIDIHKIFLFIAITILPTIKTVQWCCARLESRPFGSVKIVLTVLFLEYCRLKANRTSKSFHSLGFLPSRTSGMFVFVFVFLFLYVYTCGGRGGFPSRVFN